MPRLALINPQTNIVDNITVDDRATSKVLVQEYLVLDLDAATLKIITKTDNAEDLVEFSVGFGGIGDEWDGENLVRKVIAFSKTPETIQGAQTL